MPKPYVIICEEAAVGRMYLDLFLELRAVLIEFQAICYEHLVWFGLVWCSTRFSTARFASHSETLVRRTQQCSMRFRLAPASVAATRPHPKDKLDQPHRDAHPPNINVCCGLQCAERSGMVGCHGCATHTWPSSEA